MKIESASVSYFGSRRRVRAVRAVVTWTLLIMGFLWFMFPLAWMTSSSLKSYADLNRIPSRFLPETIMWENWANAWLRVPFARFFVNTIIIVVVNVSATLVSSSLAGYGFARLRFRGRDLLFALMLSTMMLPWWVTLIPTYLIYRELQWIDTWLPLMVPSLFGGAGSIFLVRQFFLTLPRELDEAAELDGCGKFGIYWRILLPLCKPVLATIAIFTFMGTWNAFLMPLIYLHRPQLFTVSLGLQFMRGENPGSAFEPGRQQLLMAGSIFTSAPLIIVFFLGQNYFVRGIALTGRTGM